MNFIHTMIRRASVGACFVVFSLYSMDPAQEAIAAGAPAIEYKFPDMRPEREIFMEEVTRFCHAELTTMREIMHQEIESVRRDVRSLALRMDAVEKMIAEQVAGSHEMIQRAVAHAAGDLSQQISHILADIQQNIDGRIASERLITSEEMALLRTELTDLEVARKLAEEEKRSAVRISALRPRPGKNK